MIIQDQHWKGSIGTRRYRSPGLIRKTSFKNSDKWAAVLTAYFMVEGQHMFDNEEEVLKKKFYLNRIHGSHDFRKRICKYLRNLYDAKSNTYVKKIEMLRENLQNSIV